MWDKIVAPCKQELFTWACAFTQLQMDMFALLYHGGNTIFPTCAVDGVSQLTHMQKWLSTKLTESRISSVCSQ